MTTSAPDTRPTPSPAVIRRGWWLVGGRLADHGAVFVTYILVARVIGPESFGAFAVAVLVLMVVDTATQSGIEAALIHRGTVGRHELEVGWTLGLGRGLVLGGAMLLGGGFVAGWVGTPEAAPLIRALAAVPVVRAAVSPAFVALQREFGYRRLAISSVVRALAMVSATFALASAVDGPWALVGGTLIGESARMAASYLIAPYRPQLAFDRREAISLLRYGRWITSSSVALLLLLYLDDAVVAGVLGATALGVYQIAYRLAGAPATEISFVVGQITFSTLARLREDPDRLARAFLRSYEAVASVSVPIAVALAVGADPLIEVVLGSDWSDAAPVMQILAAWGVLRALGASTTSLFRAVGRPDLPARHHWRMVIGTGVLLVPLANAWGLVGVALAVLLPNTVIHWNRYHDVAAALAVPRVEIVRQLVGPAAAGAAMAALMFVVLVAAEPLAPVAGLVLSGAAGAAAYLAVLCGLEHKGHGGALRSARQLAWGMST